MIVTGISALPLLVLLSFMSVEGQQLLQVSVQVPGREVDRLISSARTALDHGDLDAARSSLEKVLALEETNKPARLELTDVLRRMRRWNDAEDQARILIRQAPADTEPLYLLAEIAMQRGDPRTATELAYRCLARGDTRPEVYKVLAVSEYSLHENDKFEAGIRAVIERNPRDVEAHYMLARYLFEVRHYSESLKSFQTVLDLQPEHYKAHYYCGLLDVANGEDGLARAEFLSSIELLERRQAAYGWPFADLGRALNDAGELDNALGWLSRGIRNDPTCPRVYYEYARALFQKGAGAEVKDALLKALSLDPGYSEAYYLLARYYKKSGDGRAAGEALAKFRDLKDHPIPSPYGLPRQ